MHDRSGIAPQQRCWPSTLNSRLLTIDFQLCLIFQTFQPDTNHDSRITNHVYSMQELDSSAGFDPTRDREFFAALPSRPAVFVIEPHAELTGAQTYLLRTANLRQRLARLLGPPEPGSKRLNLRESAARVRYRIVGSPFELGFLHWQHQRERILFRPVSLAARGGCVCLGISRPV